MAIEGATVSSKEHQATPCVKDISVMPSLSSEITNKINRSQGFAHEFRPLHFVQPIAQSRRNDPPYWCRMKKSSAKCISCISYTRAGNDSGKLPGMTELAKIQIECDAHLPGSGIQ